MTAEYSPHRLTCSGIALARICPWSFRIDADVATVDDERFARNQACHAAFAHTINTGDATFTIPSAIEDLLTEGDLAWAQRVFDAWRADWWADQHDKGWKAEIAFAFDPHTGENFRLKPAAHRDYSEVPVGWVAGTVDAIRFDDFPGNIDVQDFKTGFWPPYADNNPQLAGLGLAAGARHLSGAIVHATEEAARTEWTAFDRFDLEDWRGEIARIVTAIPDSKPVAGPHCRDLFCNSFGLCPATKGSLERVSPEASEVVERGDVKRHLPIVMAPSGFRSAEHAAAQYVMLREADARWRELKQRAFAAVCMYADEHGGIPLPGGKVYRKVEVTREKIDLAIPEAIAVLGRELGDDGFKLAAKVKTVATKASIKVAARALKEKTGETIAHCEERVVEALRGVGAIKISKSEKFDEVKLALPASTEKKSDAA